MYSSISIEEFERRRTQGKLAVIDVRETLAFNRNHLPEAISIPLGELPFVVEQLPEDVTYHVICTLGVRSVSACEFLAEQGYEVVNVEGGMNAYQGLEK